MCVDDAAIDIVAPAADRVAAKFDDPGIGRRDDDAASRRVFVDALDEQAVARLGMVEDTPADFADACAECGDEGQCRRLADRPG